MSKEWIPWNDLDLIDSIKMDLPNGECPPWHELDAAIIIECNAFRPETTQAARCAGCPRSLCDQYETT